MDIISLKDFKLNEEGSFSITKPYESLQIVNLIAKFIRIYETINNTINNQFSILSDKVLTDATACMGGDLVRFSRYFKNVNGVEIKEENFALLMRNCKKFNCQNVTLYNQNYLDIYNKLTQDVVYLDCPWMGVGYRLKEHIVLKLGDLEIQDIVKLIKEEQLAKYIFIKAPSNVFLKNLEYDSIHTIYNRLNIESFKLICIKC
jgi:16S rRNA G966 N2-methylase RsmD